MRRAERERGEQAEQREAVEESTLLRRAPRAANPQDERADGEADGRRERREADDAGLGEHVEPQIVGVDLPGPPLAPCGSPSSPELGELDPVQGRLAL